ncbi:MAG: hypothetical protein IKY52_13370 [Clostridia bacterium]|nr:hypothetical protein [Clostridia bacterium]
MTEMRICSSGQLAEWRAQTDRRIQGIQNSPNLPIPADVPVYYVSADGEDTADGMTPDTAWKTLERVNRAELLPGAFVCFRRGDLWRGQIRARTGVTYTAYGTGDKPKLYGSPENGADPSKWQSAGAEGIWVYQGWPEDVGTIVFDHGKAHGIKCILRREKDGSVWNNTTGEPWRDYRDLTGDLHFYHDLQTGRIYLRSAENPGARFSSIEFSVKRHGFAIAGNEITIDNFEVRYVGSHGVGAGTTAGLTVQNCTFHWIGGSIQAEGLFGRNHATRYGNAVEIYGGCDRYTVRDCWFTQIYDAAVTQQVTLTPDQQKNGTDLSQKNVLYAGNVMEYCNYSVEYFLGSVPEGNPSRMENLVIADNFMWYAGRGFCSQRPDKTEAAHIKGWNHTNPAADYRIRGNVMVDSFNMLVHIYSSVPGTAGGDSMPVLENNHFAGRQGDSFGVLAYRDGTRMPYDETTPDYLGERSTGDVLWFIENQI